MSYGRDRPLKSNLQNRSGTHKSATHLRYGGRASSAKSLDEQGRMGRSLDSNKMNNTSISNAKELMDYILR